MIYLDNAATTQVDPDVLEEMLPFLTKKYGNPGAIYSLGRQAKNAIETARERVAEFIGAEYPEQIIFTSGATESNNLVLSGTMRSQGNTFAGCIVSDRLEHDSIYETARILTNNSVIYTEVDKHGRVDTDDLSALVSETRKLGIKTLLTTIMYVNNEIGSVNDVIKIGEICKDNDILFHTDCVQAAGTWDINVEDMQCDFISLSSHKIHGPKGVGALYIRNKQAAAPLIYGGKDQEFGMRGGTENVPGIIGFGKACELITKNKSQMFKDNEDKGRRFWQTLVSKAEKFGILDTIHCNGDGVMHGGKMYGGKIFSIRFDGIDAETMIIMLDTRGVSVSAGSACKSHEQKPSRVLKAIGLSDDEARETIRISFSRMNSMEDVEEAAKTIVETAFTLHRYRTS